MQAISEKDVTRASVMLYIRKLFEDHAPIKGWTYYSGTNSVWRRCYLPKRNMCVEHSNLETTENIVCYDDGKKIQIWNDTFHSSYSTHIDIDLSDEESIISIISMIYRESTNERN